MKADPTVGTSAAGGRGRIWVAGILLGLGLLGHLLAAYETGGRPVDYRHHVTGFIILTLVSGMILAAVGWRFWRGRPEITLLIVGALQALLGLVIYLERFAVAANW